MSENAIKEQFDTVELFGQYALFSNFRIDRSTIPAGWHCYDIRGTDEDFGELAYLEPYVAVNHAGSIISPQPIPFPDGKDRLDIREELGFTEHHNITIAEFCRLYAVAAPGISPKYALHPASPDEAGLFYAQTPENDAKLGCIGHVRIDFGRGGDRLYHTWHPRGPEELNTQEFKDELTEVVDEMRESVLKDFSSMKGYCDAHGGTISSGRPQNYGYIVETENYRYCLRCNPVHGDYQAYLTCFDKRVQEMNQARDLQIVDSFGKTVTLRPRLELYSVTDYMGTELPGLAIVLDEVGKRPDDMEQYAVLTVSFGEHISIKNSAYIDTNNCRFADQLLEKGIAESTGFNKRSGFCEYPLWLFKEEFLRAIGGENYRKYANAYDHYMNPSAERGPLAVHSLADLKRVIKPGTELVATRHSKHPDIVGLVRVVTAVQSNAFYSVIKDQPDHKFSTCNNGDGFRSNFEKASNYQFDGTTVKVLDPKRGDGTILCEFEVYEQEMKMDSQESTEDLVATVHPAGDNSSAPSTCEHISGKCSASSQPSRNSH